tara:strand:+ start:204 stop:569 length:366 start_codon:yes stop_codon:yes gene_type:complete
MAIQLKIIDNDLSKILVLVNESINEKGKKVKKDEIIKLKNNIHLCLNKINISIKNFEDSFLNISRTQDSYKLENNNLEKRITKLEKNLEECYSIINVLNAEKQDLSQQLDEFIEKKSWWCL